MSMPFSADSGIRILHIEDNELDAELIGEVLRQEWPRCRIERVETRQQLLTKIEGKSWDLVLSDYSLPGFDGLSALSMVSGRLPRVPFIFVSGTIGEESAVEALKRGATDYVIKDRPARLVPAIRQAFALLEEESKTSRLEGKLHETRELFEQLAERSNEVFWFTSSAPDQVIFVSPAVETVWQVPAEDFYRHPETWQDRIHPEDRQRVLLAYGQAISGERERFEAEYRIVRADGTIAWVADRRTPIRDSISGAIRMSGIAADITDRRRSEERIREQAKLIEAAREAIIVSDLQHRITAWNSGAGRIFGRNEAEVVSRTVFEIFGEHALELVKAMSGSDPAGEWSGELTLPHPDEGLRLIDCGITVVRNDAGQPYAYLIIGLDITERRKLEKQVLQAQRLDSIGTLAGGIAHDLNNMLAPILMSVELLQLDANSERTAQSLRMIEKRTRHGAALVRQVLAFARGSTGERVKIQPRLVVDDVVDLLRETLPRSIAISCDLPPDLALIRGNPTEFGQILMNLCVNARDAMPDGGQLRIEGRNLFLNQEDLRGEPSAHPGPYLRLSVSDNGTGIPPEIIDRIFDPFFTTKEVGKGTGLGLSTTIGIIRSQGGFLRVDSQPGAGSTFSVFCPAENDDDALEESAPGTGRWSQGNRETILIIDDDENLRGTTAELLEHTNFQVLLAANGQDGLKVFQDNLSRIEAVILDLMMPGAQGDAVARKLRELSPGIPILLLSGLLEVDLDTAGISPPVAFMRKPASSFRLIHTLQQILSERE